MRRDEFLRDLERLLAKLPEGHRSVIMADYAEHFAIGEARGKTASEIALALGSPRQIAAACVADLAFAQVYAPQNPGQKLLSIVRALFAAVGLAFFNSFFLLLPVLIAAGALTSFWLVALSPILLGGTWIIKAAGEYGAALVSSLEGWGHLFFGLSMVLLGSMLVVVMALFTQLLAKLARKYVRLNLLVLGV